jgi:hypothetical protein
VLKYNNIVMAAALCAIVSLRITTTTSAFALLPEQIFALGFRDGCNGVNVPGLHSKQYVAGHDKGLANQGSICDRSLGVGSESGSSSAASASSSSSSDGGGRNNIAPTRTIDGSHMTVTDLLNLVKHGQPINDSRSSGSAASAAASASVVNQGGFNPQQQSGPNWIDRCNTISFALVSSCTELVNPDNTLTPQGIHVRNCIENGAALAAGAILLGTSPYVVVKALPLVARLGGCEGVINFNMNLGQLKNLGSLIR